MSPQAEAVDSIYSRHKKVHTEDDDRFLQSKKKKKKADF